MAAHTPQCCPRSRPYAGSDMFLPWARADRKLEHHNLDEPGVIYRSLLPKVTRAGPAYQGTSPTDVHLRCQVRSALCLGWVGLITTRAHTRHWHRPGEQNPDGTRSKRCDDPAFYREVMAEQYPRVEVYDCDAK